MKISEKRLRKIIRESIINLNEENEDDTGDSKKIQIDLSSEDDEITKWKEFHYQTISYFDELLKNGIAEADINNIKDKFIEIDNQIDPISNQPFNYIYNNFEDLDTYDVIDEKINYIEYIIEEYKHYFTEELLPEYL